jgi:hypothetical protein
MNDGERISRIRAELTDFVLVSRSPLRVLCASR